MKGKAAAILLCLAFALPFGGVGAWAAYAIATMIYDGTRAEDWVRVKAHVIGPSTYRYSFGGTTYTGERLDASRFGGSDNIDDFHDRMADLFAQARGAGKPITVLVNPDAPSEAMVEGIVRWGMVLFLVPFAIGFGAVGAGACYFAYRILRGPAQAQTPAPSGTGGLWFFAIIWNAISFPIAALAVPQAIAEDEWGVLLVLIFPLIGLLLLWGAAAATFKRFFTHEQQARAPTPRRARKQA